MEKEKMTFKEVMEWKCRELLQMNQDGCQCDGELKLMEYVRDSLETAEHHPGKRTYCDVGMGGIMFDMYASVLYTAKLANTMRCCNTITSALGTAVMHNLDIQWYG